MDDADLVESIRAGKQRAWNDLVDRHGPFLYRLARSVVNDHELAEDAMQTAMMRLLSSIDKLSEPGSVRSWLATTVRREALALSKAQRRQEPTDDDWGLHDADRSRNATPDPGVTATQNEQNKIILEAMRDLSDKCQSLIVMFAHKLKYGEITAALDIPTGSIGPTTARCLDQMRRHPLLANLEMHS